MSNYSQQELMRAPIKDSAHYATLKDPRFEGQTRVDENDEYIMYFSSEGNLFGYRHKL